MEAPRRPQAQGRLNIRCTTACKIAEELSSFELLPCYHLLIWLNDSGPRVTDLRRSAIPFHVFHQRRPDFYFMLLLMNLTASTCVSVVCKNLKYPIRTLVNAARVQNVGNHLRIVSSRLSSPSCEYDISPQLHSVVVITVHQDRHKDADREPHLAPSQAFWHTDM